MRVVPSVFLLSAILAIPAFAQYGGREGDAVIYVLTAKGSPDFVTVPKTTVNTVTGFATEDPGALPDELSAPISRANRAAKCMPSPAMFST